MKKTYVQRKYYEDPLVDKWIKKKYPQKYSAWQRSVNLKQMLKEMKKEKINNQ